MLKQKNIFNSDKWFYAGGEKGAFLKQLPNLRTLTKILKKSSQNASENLKKEKTND